jgi:hypothetical protein
MRKPVSKIADQEVDDLKTLCQELVATALQLDRAQKNHELATAAYYNYVSQMKKV